MMRGRNIFGEVVGKVLFSWARIDDEVLLAEAILHPVKSHVHRF